MVSAWVVFIFMVVVVLWLWKESNKPKYRCLHNIPFGTDVLKPKEKVGCSAKRQMARKCVNQKLSI